ncbi:unnamed protein product [Clavelina lepadiformis]|uniref:Uncharacterized protein n=1 Tax=Clavelina lepadiformis TaxID=159417 RepID=A0ABP0GK57_CLALP
MSDSNLDAIIFPDDVDGTKEEVTSQEKARDTWMKMKSILKFRSMLKVTRKILPVDEDQESRDSNFFDHSFTRRRWSSINNAQRATSESKEFEDDEIPIKGSEKDPTHKRSRLVINPEGSFLKVWLALITVIVLYYAWILIARQAFEQLRTYVSLILSSFVADE